MEEEDTGMVSCCRQPSEEEGRLERERERERERDETKLLALCGVLYFTVLNATCIILQK